MPSKFNVENLFCNWLFKGTCDLTLGCEDRDRLVKGEKIQ